MSNGQSANRWLHCLVQCTPLASWWLASSREGLKEPEDEEHEEEYDEMMGVDTTTDDFGDAGQPCEICNDQACVKSHFAMPCRHTACGDCWKEWLSRSDKCMICGTRVSHSQRFSESVVPLSLAERVTRSPSLPGRHGPQGSPALEEEGVELPQLYMQNQRMQTILEELMGALVTTKGCLGGATEKIAQSESHLMALRGQPTDLESQLSVVAVEKLMLREAFQALSDAFVSPSGQPGGKWAEVGEGTQSLQEEVDAMGEALDAATDERPSGLEGTRSVLRTCSGPTIKGQWTPMRAQLLQLHHELIPSSLKCLAALGLTRQDMMDVAALSQGAAMLRRQGEEEIGKMDRLLAALLPEVEVILVRVESWFDDAFEAE